MKRNIALCCLVVSGLVAGHGMAWADAPSFTISAPNVTMTNAAYTPMPFTLTSVNGFAGSIFVGCNGPTVAAGEKIPFCQSGPVAHVFVLAANGTTTGVFDLYPYEDIVPGVVTQTRPSRGGGVIWALAGVAMLGLGLRRKKRFGAGRLLLMTCMMVGLAGMSACAGGRPTLTPGTYAYTLIANEQVSLPPGPSASTTVQVTVPPGIVIPSGN